MKNRSEEILVASTTLRYKGQSVLVSVFLPEKEFADSSQYACKFSISGGEIDYAGKSIGFDSMQSLILSLKKIGTFLESSDDLDQELIEWDGGAMKFPVFS